MSIRTLLLAAVALCSLPSASLVLSSPAAARPFCEYRAYDPMGKLMADGYAWAMKMSWACNRARRRCNRELERKRR
jgi:hypothetical protein